MKFKSIFNNKIFTQKDFRTYMYRYNLINDDEHIMKPLKALLITPPDKTHKKFSENWFHENFFDWNVNISSIVIDTTETNSSIQDLPKSVLELFPKLKIPFYRTIFLQNKTRIALQLLTVAIATAIVIFIKVEMLFTLESFDVGRFA